MNELEPERLLQRYRPAGPSADLRGRIIGEYRAARAWPWAAAAAALLAVTLTLRAGAGAQVTNAYVPTADAREAAIEELTGQLGGTAEARALAEAVSLQERIRAARPGLTTAESR